MDDYEVKSIMAIGDIFCDETAKGTIRLSRIEAVQELLGFVRALKERHLKEELIEAVWQKKLEFIMAAKSKSELKDIMRPSLPKLVASGEMVPTSPYHVEEEELLLWAIISPHMNIISEAQERYKVLFRKFFPKQARDSNV